MKKIKSITPLIPSSTEKKLPVYFKASTRINPYALGYSLGILSELFTLVISILGKFGYALSWVEFYKGMLIMYSLKITGIILGTAESALCGLIFGFLLGWLYNKLS